MTIYQCGRCGFEGHCYGNEVSAPWCSRCQMNDALTRQTPARCEYCAGSGEVFGKDGPTICPHCDGRGCDA